MKTNFDIHNSGTAIQEEQSAEILARSEHVQVLLSNNIYAFLANLAAGATLVIGAWERIPHRWLLVWLCAVILLNTFRWVSGLRHAGGVLDEQELHKWDRKILISVFLSGALWGCAGGLFFLPGVPAHNFFLTVMIIGLAAAAATTLSYHRWAYPVFVVPAVAPVTIALMREDGTAEIALGLITPFYFLLMFLLSKKIYRTAHASILLRLKHQHLANHDHLTGVANRRAFEETMDREWLRAQRSQTSLSLIIADIDDFKHYNDTFGHAVGDDVLRAIAQMIAERIRQSADLVARVGGEELAVILPETDIDGAKTLAEQIREQCHKIDIDLGRGIKAPNLSIGVSTCVPQENQRVEELFEQADGALYDAKRQGKDRVVARAI